MKKTYQQFYRVECNFGSKYFKSADKAFAYFQRKANKHLDVEIWLVIYTYYAKKSAFSASQELLDYSATDLPKF